MKKNLKITIDTLKRWADNTFMKQEQMLGKGSKELSKVEKNEELTRKNSK